MQDMARMEAVWIRILGVLLVLLGLTLFTAPRIAYTRSENIPHTHLVVEREKSIVVPRVATVLIMGAGAMVLIIVRKRID